MTPIINIYFNKNPIPWEIIYCRLLHPSNSDMKTMCHHQTLTILQKKFPGRLNQAPCTIFYTSKITTFPKGKTVDTSNIQPGELIYMDFSF